MTRLAAIAALALAGCGSIAPTVPPSAQPEADAGYVAGLFSRDGMSFALVLRSGDGALAYTMPMGEDTRWPTDVRDSPVVIKVRPGTYTIAEWFTYSTVDKKIASRVPNDLPLLGRPFTVDAGAVVYLGRFTTEWRRRYTDASRTTVRQDMRVHPVPAAAADVRKAFGAAYPALASQRFDCAFCGAP